MNYIVVDVESDGPIPHKYSMLCFGAVVVEPSLTKTFYGKTKPISNLYDAEALAVSGFTRQEHETFDDPKTVMEQFAVWLSDNSKSRPIFISDNPAFDWQWINWYFHTYLGKNPFGFSARRIGDLYCGMKMDAGKCVPAGASHQLATPPTSSAVAPASVPHALAAAASLIALFVFWSVAMFGGFLAVSAMENEIKRV